jgi:hypothetical protein
MGSIVQPWEHGNFHSAGWAYPEIEYAHADGLAPGHWTGLAGMSEGFREVLSTLEDFRVTADELRELDNGCGRVDALAEACREVRCMLYTSHAPTSTSTTSWSPASCAATGCEPSAPRSISP